MRRALALALHHRGPMEQARAHQTLAVAYGRPGDDRRALDRARLAFDLYRTFDHPRGSPKRELHCRNRKIVKEALAEFFERRYSVLPPDRGT